VLLSRSIYSRFVWSHWRGYTFPLCWIWSISPLKSVPNFITRHFVSILTWKIGMSFPWSRFFASLVMISSSGVWRRRRSSSLSIIFSILPSFGGRTTWSSSFSILSSLHSRMVWVMRTIPWACRWASRWWVSSLWNLLNLFPIRLFISDYMNIFSICI